MGLTRKPRLLVADEDALQARSSGLHGPPISRYTVSDGDRTDSSGASMRRPPGSLTKQSIVNAGLELADLHGVEAVTIRAVATHVGAAPMSLYARIANEDELLDLMHCELSRRTYEGAEHPTWQAELLAVCNRLRYMLKAHPNWLGLSTRPSAAFPRLRTRDRVLRMMIDDGLPTEDAFQTLVGALTVATAVTMMELRTTGDDGKPLVTSRIERTRETSREADRAVSPTTMACAQLDHFDIDQLFQATMRGLIKECEAHRATR